MDKIKARRWLPAFRYFCSLVSVPSKEMEKPSPITFYTAQNLILEQIEDGLANDIHHFVFLKARQLGASTLLLLLDLFWLYMHPGLQGAFVCDTAENREVFRETIRQMMASLPKGYQIPVEKHDRTMLVLANGSRLQYMSAGLGKNAGLGRSRGLNFGHFSELGRWGDPKGYETLMDTLALENPNRLYLFESTALGFNLFYDCWHDALASPESRRAAFIGWWAKEPYSLVEGSPEFQRWWGAFPAYTEYEQRITQEVFNEHGVEILPEQWAWYRSKADGRSEQSVFEEFPACVSGDTRVGTAQGILRIDEVATGALTTLGVAEAAGPTGVAEMYRLRTKLGYELRGTANHPMALADGGFVELKDAVGSRIRLQPPRTGADQQEVRWREGPVECSVDITPEMARFVGIFMGDGSMSGNPYFQLSIACDAQDTDLVEEVKRLIRDLFGLEPITRLMGPTKGCLEVRTSGRELFRTIRQLGLMRKNGGGQYKRKVHVPEFIFRSPPHIIREFLRGLFEADGFVARNGYNVRFFTKYPDFARDVQLLLLAMGVPSSVRHMEKKSWKPDGSFFTYPGNDLSLRQAAVRVFADKIGMISRRKNDRLAIAASKPIAHNELPLAVDDIVEEVRLDGEAEAYNLTVAGEHLFDAYGLLTHNTASEAFQATGSPFFSLQKVTADIDFIRGAGIAFQGYTYELGDNFLKMKLRLAREIEDVDLRVWEKPQSNAKYVIGVDPAFGSSEEADSTVIGVWRCFADKLVQVAEYASPLTTTQNCAWVLGHLAGEYRDVMINLEYNGGGGEVALEMKHLRQSMQFGQLQNVARDMNVERALDSARWFYWRRPDSIGGAPSAHHFTTNGQNKPIALNRMNDAYISNALIIRSLPLLDEMTTMKREGDKIAASGRNKDDRVMSAMLAVYAWREWVQPGMMSGNRTFEREMREQMNRQVAGADVLAQIVPSFLADRAAEREGRSLRQLLEGPLQ